MSLVTKIVEFVEQFAGATGGGRDDDVSEEQLAAAALLVHVARADGRIDPAERARLVDLLSKREGWSDGAVSRLVDRADGLDREIDDVAELIDMMGHSLSPDGKRSFVGMAYEIAAADGRVDEFEDDLVWRVGHLMGLADDEISAIRASTVGAAGGSDAVRGAPA